MKTRLLVLVGIGCLWPGLAGAADDGITAQSEKTAQVVAARSGLDQAIELYRAQVAANPKDAVAHNKLGVCYQKANKGKLARKEYRKAVDLEPPYAEAWNNLATLEHASRHYKKAVALYQKAVELKPEHAIFHRNLGVAWLAVGDVPRAMTAFGEAVRLDPHSLEGDPAAFRVSGIDRARVCFAYAKVFAARGDFESAFAWLFKAKDAGFRDFSKVSSDPDFAAVVKDPRFAALARND